MRPMSYRELAFAVLSRFIDDIEREDLRRIVDKTYTRATFGSDAITPLSTLEPGLHVLHLSNGPTLAFKDIALQFLGNLFEYVLAREHRGSISWARPRATPAARRSTRCAASAALPCSCFRRTGRMSPFQVAQMFSLDRCQHPQPRDRGNVRRLPGHREGGQRRRRVQVTTRARRGQFDQLGARGGAGRLLLLGILPGHAHEWGAGRLRGAVGQLRQYPGRSRRPRAWFADSPPDPCHERERRARRVLPHRPLSSARRRRKRTPRPRRRWTSPRRPTSSASYSTWSVAIPRSFATFGRASLRAGRSIWRHPRTGSACKRRDSFRAAARMPTDVATIRDDRRALRRRRSIRTPLTGSRWDASIATPRCRSCASRRRLPVKFGATIREALGRDPARPAAFDGIEQRPQRFVVLPADASKVKAIIEESAAAA